MESPQTVILTQRAFNAIVTETISKHPIETGGIFLGYVMDNGTWIFVENVAPGAKSTHRSAYFEYDTAFVTYLANVLANQYKGNLQILGLWCFLVQTTKLTVTMRLTIRMDPSLHSSIVIQSGA